MDGQWCAAAGGGGREPCNGLSADGDICGKDIAATFIGGCEAYGVGAVLCIDMKAGIGCGIGAAVAEVPEIAVCSGGVVGYEERILTYKGSKNSIRYVIDSDVVRLCYLITSYAVADGQCYAVGAGIVVGYYGIFLAGGRGYSPGETPVPGSGIGGGGAGKLNGQRGATVGGICSKAGSGWCCDGDVVKLGAAAAVIGGR